MMPVSPKRADGRDNTGRTAGSAASAVGCLGGVEGGRGLLAKNFTSGYFGPVTDPPPDAGKGPGPMRYAGLGIQLAASILLFVWAGQWLDGRFNTGGLFTILGAFLGLGGTMWLLFRSLRQDERDRR